MVGKAGSGEDVRTIPADVGSALQRLSDADLMLAADELVSQSNNWDYAYRAVVAAQIPHRMDIDLQNHLERTLRSSVRSWVREDSEQALSIAVRLADLFPKDHRDDGYDRFGPPDLGPTAERSVRDVLDRRPELVEDIERHGWARQGQDLHRPAESWLSAQLLHEAWMALVAAWAVTEATHDGPVDSAPSATSQPETQLRVSESTGASAELQLFAGPRLPSGRWLLLQIVGGSLVAVLGFLLAQSADAATTIYLLLAASGLITAGLSTASLLRRRTYVKTLRKIATPAINRATDNPEHASAPATETSENDPTVNAAIEELYRLGEFR